PPHDLHSFPTRRSSDLFFLAASPCSNAAFASGVPALSCACAITPPKRKAKLKTSSPAFFRIFFITDCLLKFAVVLFLKQSFLTRSEEHTSELQSRSDLV